MNTPLTTPVLLIAWSRPKMTRLVFDAIRKARPEKLYLAVDGLPTGDENRKRLRGEVMEVIAAVDWPCQVYTKFNDQHIGMREAVPAALDWFFSCEPEGIVLEDDCLPSGDFFLFCQSLLQRYRDDVRIRHISGTNLQFGVRRGNASYYFGQIPAIWGWAGWRRVWKDFSLDMKAFPEFIHTQMMDNVLPDPSLARRLESVLQSTFDGRIKTWDHQYGYSVVINHGLCINPNSNLVSNLGVMPGDDPQRAVPGAVAAIAHRPIDFPLTHPKIFVPDLRADLLQVSWSTQDDSRDIPRKVMANANFKFEKPDLTAHL